MYFDENIRNVTYSHEYTNVPYIYVHIDIYVESIMDVRKRRTWECGKTTMGGNIRTSGCSHTKT